MAGAPSAVPAAGVLPLTREEWKEHEIRQIAIAANVEFVVGAVTELLAAAKRPGRVVTVDLDKVRVWDAGTFNLVASFVGGGRL